MSLRGLSDFAAKRLYNIALCFSPGSRRKRCPGSGIRCWAHLWVSTRTASRRASAATFPPSAHLPRTTADRKGGFFAGHNPRLEPSGVICSRLAVKVRHVLSGQIFQSSYRMPDSRPATGGAGARPYRSLPLEFSHTWPRLRLPGGKQGTARRNVLRGNKS
jgi:hypothetical protein